MNKFAGWDADACFAQARAKMKLADNAVIHHRFIGVDGVIIHEYRG